VRPKNKGFKNPFEIKPNPLQFTKKSQHRIKGHNPRVDLYPLIEQKIKFGVFFFFFFLEKLGFGWVGDKMEIWGFGWPAVSG
jgi:hypothetical protein